MVYEAVRQLSVIPGGDIAILRFVEPAALGKVTQVNSAGDTAFGVAMEAADVSASTAAIPVAILDGSKIEVEAGAAIDVSSAAVPVASDASGRAIPATGSQRVLGYAFTSATAAGQVVTIVGAYGPGAATGPGTLFRDTYTTVGGSAAEAITISGLVGTEVCLVTLRTPGSTPRTIASYALTTDTLTVTFSGDPADDHVIDYVIFPA